MAPPPSAPTPVPICMSVQQSDRIVRLRQHRRDLWLASPQVERRPLSVLHKCGMRPTTCFSWGKLCRRASYRWRSTRRMEGKRRRWGCGRFVPSIPELRPRGEREAALVHGAGLSPCEFGHGVQILYSGVRPLLCHTEGPLTIPHSFLCSHPASSCLPK